MRTALVSVLTSALCLAAAGPSFAQEGTPPAIDDARTAARALAEKGFELFEAGKHAEAYQHFQQAEARFHAPPHIVFMARAQAKLGKLLAARDLYQQVVDEKLANYAPDEFRKFQGDARAELDALKKRIPTLHVVVKGTSPASAVLTLDGAKLPDGALQAPWPFDPGTHLVEGTAEAASAKASVVLSEGDHEVVELDLAPGRTATEGAPPPVPDTAAPAPGRPRLIVPAIAAFGVGAVGLGIGAITGAMSLGKVSDIKDKCNESVCPPDQESEADSAKTLGTVSTIGFVLGGVGVAAGAILLVLDGGGAPAEAPAAKGPTLRPRIGFGFVGLDGKF